MFYEFLDMFEDVLPPLDWVSPEKRPLPTSYLEMDEPFDERLNRIEESWSSDLFKMVNPKTLSPIKDPLKFIIGTDTMLYAGSPIKIEENAPCYAKASHIHHDHDYISHIRNDDSHVVPQIHNELDALDKEKCDVDQVVDVWGIEDKKPTINPLPAQRNLSQSLEMTSLLRRSSSRAAEIKIREQTKEFNRREQAKEFNSAVNASLKKAKRSQKVRQTRQFKSFKPKNSVETTPSQSDIDEWSSQPVKPTLSKITKKKTTKGRINHSESERLRRQDLGNNFTILSKVVPMSFLRGDKVSNQISKQKILTGSKAFITAQLAARKQYRRVVNRNNRLKDRYRRLSNILKRAAPRFAAN